MYGSGTGLPQNQVRGLMWYTIAAAGGHSVARQARDEILGSNLLTLDQVAEAERLAREWTEQHR